MPGRSKGDGQRKSYVVNGEADKINPRRIGRGELVKIRHSQRASKLARAIRAKVEEDNSIAVLNRSDWPTILANDHDWRHKFIGYSAFIRTLDCCNRILSAFAFGMNQQLVCALC